MKSKITLKYTFRIASLFIIVLLYQNCGQFQSTGVIDGDSFNSSTNTGTESNKAILDCSSPKAIDSTVISRMTRKQIYLSLLDLIGFRDSEDLELLPLDSANDKGFRNEGISQLLFPDDGKKFFDFFEKVVSDAIDREDSKVFTCDINTSGCINQIIDSKAYLAHRGQPNAETMTKIKNSLISFSSAEEKLKWGLVSVFLLPEYLYHESSAENSGKKLLNDYKIADRLASMLWFSLPDTELLTAAKNGELSSPEGLSAQVDRMVSHSKISRFSYNFAEQWLSLDSANTHYADASEISDDLSAALIAESRALLNHVVTNDLPINELISANYTFLNIKSAAFYVLNTTGLSDNLVKVSTGAQRSGIFSHAAVIAGMSEPGNTNPTARGYWVLKRVFCLPPGAIPGSLMNIVDSFSFDETLPMKERLASLSSSSTCGNCHRQMDPTGVAFENFDSFGQIRTHNGPHPVDTTGELIDGSTFSKSIDLIAKMQSSSLYNFESCFSQHLTSLARTKIAKKGDLCSTNKLITKDNMTFKEVVKALVTSDLFLR